MNSYKQDIIRNIKNSLKGHIEHAYIIGSFASRSWVEDKSDIDIIIIDKSFEKYHNKYNKKYIKKLIGNLPYKIDIFLYTPKSFEFYFNLDEKMRIDIEKGIELL